MEQRASTAAPDITTADIINQLYVGNASTNSTLSRFLSMNQKMCFQNYTMQ
jgi:hypothetical protein